MTGVMYELGTARCPRTREARIRALHTAPDMPHAPRTHNDPTCACSAAALLSEYAADVFAGLFAVADATNSRISAVAAQVTTTTKSIAAMEARLQAPLASAAAGALLVLP